MAPPIRELLEQIEHGTSKITIMVKITVIAKGSYFWVT
jgi:hypothetical protein